MRYFSLLFAVAVIGVGCQASPRLNRHIELLNAEKRTLEDQLYDLEYDYEELVRRLQRVQCENDELQQRLGLPPSERGRSSGSDRSRSVRPNRAPRSSSPDLSPPMIDGDLSEPKIEIPDETQGTSTQPRSTSNLAPVPPTAPMIASFAGSTESTTTRTSASLEPADPRITHIHLDPLLTGGSDFDKHPGDDGVIVAIEPRNSENVFVPLAGPVSIVVLDPAKEGAAANVARWDLEASATQAALQNSRTEKGIQLRLPWPDRPPANGRLQLFVRYVTVDGRKLEASREIFVTPPGQITQRWTPRSAAREELADQRKGLQEQQTKLDEMPAELIAPDDATEITKASYAEEAVPTESADQPSGPPADAPQWRAER